MSIASIGCSVVVNDIVIHILIFMNVSVISGIPISKFIRISVHLEHRLSFWVLPSLHFVVEVLINKVITSVSIIFDLLVIRVVTIDDTITVSDISLGIFGHIFVHSIFIDSNGVIQLIITFMIKLD